MANLGAQEEGSYGGGNLGLFIGLHELGIVGEVGDWVNKHVIQPVKHFVSRVEKWGGEFVEQLHGQCKPGELKMFGGCFGKGPTVPDEPPFAPA